jgi:transposase
VAERRKFTREFKLEVVRSILEGGKSIAQTSRELEIRRNQLQRWVAEYKADGQAPFPGSGHQKPAEEELARLRRELKRVQQERDILKKAIAIFSEEPR